VGTVHVLGVAEGEPLGDAVAAFLASMSRPETQGTRRTYSVPLNALVAEFGEPLPLDGIEPVALAAWFSDRYGERSPSTWNVALDAMRSAWRWWGECGWTAGAADPTARLRRAKRAPNRARALSRAEVEQLLTREDVALREKTLWRLLYESAARISEVLGLDVPDLDLPNRRAPVRRKGNAVDVITWQTGTARLLPRLIGGRRSGPLFLTDRKARVELAPYDIDPASGRARLSYRRAEEIFKAASDGATIHQLRHSTLTHAAEDGANTSTLLSYSGHTSVRSLAPYARVSAEALGRWQAERDPARRR
jgi:integrase